MAAANEWGEQFQQVEAECLQDKGDIDYEVVKSEMARRGIEKAQFLHAGLVKGRMERPGKTKFLIFFGLAGLSVLTLGAIFTYRSIRFLARHRA